MVFATICHLFCIIGLVASQTYKIPPVVLDSVNCLFDSQRTAVRNDILNNISEILTNYSADTITTYNIPGCGGSGWKRVAFLNMTESDETCPEQWSGDCMIVTMLEPVADQ